MTDLLAPTPELLAAQPAHGALVFALERLEDGRAANALIDRAFGPGRMAKTAERLRENNRLRHDLSVCAWDGTRLAGVVRQWPVLIGDTPAVFLGPFAVDEAFRHRKLGATLIEQAVALSDAAGVCLTVLVGPASYFAPFGFTKVPGGRVIPPGPVDATRLLWRPGTTGALDGIAGPLRIPPAG